MKKTLFTVALFTVFLAAAANADGPGWMSRYWDGCKPSCSWSGNAAGNPCKECDRSNNKLTTSDANRSACDGGNAYTCWDMIPYAVNDNLAYGFVATHPPNKCGSCYELTFNGRGQHTQSTRHAALNGKKMIVMASNIGGDVDPNQFDLLVPGGGVGAFDAFSSQIGKSKSDLGQQYGGLLSDCESQGDPASCLRTKCASVFSGQPLLKQGCDFYADWLKGAGNPQYDAKTVTCPQELVDIYKGTKTGPGGGGGPIVVPPTTTTYTVQVGRSPTAGGNVKVNNGQDNPSGQSTHNANTSITIAATANNGYSFQNWTAVSGTQLPSGINANSASITFNINANVNIQANFQTTTPPTQTYTVQVGRNPTAGGSVAVTVNGNTQTNPSNSQTVNANTSVTVTATAASGYTFQNWTAVSGSLPSGFNATNASNTFSVNATVNIRANFQQSNPPPGGTYTLNVSRNPAAGGNVTVNGGANNPGQSTHNAGASITVAAAANNGYTFQNWTAASGALPSGINAGSPSVTFSISGNVSLQANFQQTPVVVPPAGNMTDTIKVEAEDLSAPTLGNCDNNSNNNPMCKGTNNGITNIGWINGGNSATYNVEVGKAGAKTMVFKIASNYDQGQSSFQVTVNGTQVGTVTGHTNDWDGYTYVTLSPNAQFNAGANTVKLDFSSPVNVDYFLIIGEKATPISVAYNAVKAAPKRAAVTLTASPKGFSAALPAGHGYSSYKLIDMQGREVKSGRIGQGVTSLRFDNLTRGVLFLKLDGKGNTPVVLRAVTY